MVTTAYRPREITLRNGRSVTMRSISAGDEQELIEAFGRMSSESRYNRFMAHTNEVSAPLLARGLRPVPGEEFVYVATVPAADGYDIVGAARYTPTQPGDHESCEFSITVVDDWHRSGLGRELMACLIRRARRDGYNTMVGHVLASNGGMLRLARKLGFKVERDPDDAGAMRVVKDLRTRQSPVSV